MTSPRQQKIQNISLTNGEIRYTWVATLTELKGQNISADSAKICLGTETTPGTPLTPDVLTPQTTTVANFLAQGGTNPFKLPPTQTLYQLAVQLLVGDQYKPALNSYWVWAQLPDAPELGWFRFHKVTIT